MGLTHRHFFELLTALFVLEEGLERYFGYHGLSFGKNHEFFDLVHWVGWIQEHIIIWWFLGIFDVIIRIFVVQQLIFILFFLVSHITPRRHLLMWIGKIRLACTYLILTHGFDSSLILFIIGLSQFFQMFDNFFSFIIFHGITFLDYPWPTSDKLQKITFSAVILTKFIGEWVNCNRLLSRQLMVDYVVVEFWEVLLDTQELFQLVWFLDSWDHDEVLQILLEHISSVIYGVASSITATWNTHSWWSSFDILKAFLSKLVAAFRKLNAGILIDEGLV